MIYIFRRTNKSGKKGIDRNSYDEEVIKDPESTSIHDLDSVFWIDLLCPEDEELDFVGKLFGIVLPQDGKVREIESTSRLYIENGARFMTSSILGKSDSAHPIPTEVTFILVPNCLITMRRVALNSFRSYSDSIQKAETCSRDTAFIGLIGTIIDRQADLLEKLASDLDGLSKAIFTSGKDALNTDADYDDDSVSQHSQMATPEDRIQTTWDREHSKPIKKQKAPMATARLKLTLQELGRVGDLLARQRDCMANLSRLITFAGNEVSQSDPTTTHSLAKQLLPANRDVRSITEYATFLSGNVNFMLDAVLGLINIEQNEIVKIFTVASVIFMPPTLIASIYGMNFQNMPELSSQWGYPGAILGMAISVIVPLVYFRSKRFF
jgi:magnesium transporter